MIAARVARSRTGWAAERILPTGHFASCLAGLREINHTLFEDADSPDLQAIVRKTDTQTRDIDCTCARLYAAYLR